MLCNVLVFSDNHDLVFSLKTALMANADISKNEKVELMVADKESQLLKQLIVQLPHLVVLDCRKFDNNYQGLRDLLTEIQDKYHQVEVLLCMSQEFERQTINDNLTQMGVVDVINTQRFAKELPYFCRLYCRQHWMKNQPSWEQLPGGQLFPMQKQWLEQWDVSNHEGINLAILPALGDDRDRILPQLAQHLHTLVVDFREIETTNFVDYFFGSHYNSVQKSVYRRGIIEEYEGQWLILRHLEELTEEHQLLLWQWLKGSCFSRHYSKNKRDLRLNLVSCLDAADYVQRIVPELLNRLYSKTIVLPNLSDYCRHVTPQQFWQELVAITGEEMQITPEALHILQHFPWHIGFSGLRAIWSQIVLQWRQSGEKTIGLQHFPFELLQDYQCIIHPALNYEVLSLPLAEAKIQFERQYLQAQLERFGHSVTETAKFVGIQRPVLHRKIREYDLVHKPVSTQD